MPYFYKLNKKYYPFYNLNKMTILFFPNTVKKMFKIKRISKSLYIIFYNN